jgi:hypothetical protein
MLALALALVPGALFALRLPDTREPFSGPSSDAAPGAGPDSSIQPA